MEYPNDIYTHTWFVCNFQQLTQPLFRSFYFFYLFHLHREYHRLKPQLNYYFALPFASSQFAPNLGQKNVSSAQRHASNSQFAACLCVCNNSCLKLLQLQLFSQMAKHFLTKVILLWSVVGFNFFDGSDSNKSYVISSCIEGRILFFYTWIMLISFWF